jgi:hypothetical protein
LFFDDAVGCIMPETGAFWIGLLADVVPLRDAFRTQQVRILCSTEPPQGVLGS